MATRGIFATAIGAVWGILSILPYFVWQLGPIQGAFIWATLPAWLTLILPDQIPLLHFWLNYNWLTLGILYPARMLLTPFLGALLVYGTTSLIGKIINSLG